jgi:sec-independent protein translocase protein TatA
MPNIGPAEIAVVLIVALLILGPKRLPQAGRGMGQAIREFKDGITSRGGEETPAPALMGAEDPQAPGSPSEQQTPVAPGA